MRGGEEMKKKEKMKQIIISSKELSKQIWRWDFSLQYYFHSFIFHFLNYIWMTAKPSKGKK